MSEKFTEQVAAELRGEMRRRIPPMTQDQLAALTGIAKQTLSRRLAGDPFLRVDELARICAAMDLSVEDLVRRAQLGLTAAAVGNASTGSAA